MAQSSLRRQLNERISVSDGRAIGRQDRSNGAVLWRDHRQENRSDLKQADELPGTHRIARYDKRFALAWMAVQERADARRTNQVPTRVLNCLGVR